MASERCALAVRGADLLKPVQYVPFPQMMQRRLTRMPEGGFPEQGGLEPRRSNDPLRCCVGPDCCFYDMTRFGFSVDIGVGGLLERVSE